MDKESSPKPKRPALPLVRSPHRLGSNLLLSLLPEGERQRVEKRCQKQSLGIETVLYEAGGKVDSVYFPLSGMVSLVIGGEEGLTVEVAVIGNEGVAGLGTAFGADHSHLKAVIQMEGEFLRMPRKDFLAELKASETLNRLVQRYSQALMAQSSQSVLCNRAHPVDERTARWLLMAHDRAGTDEIHLTQRFIAEMLGVRRPSVTVAAGLLQQAGLIKYARGSVTIVDRQGLESAACECYAIVNQELKTLLLE
jgi:CRP-like cAMP-binding protein